MGCPIFDTIRSLPAPIHWSVNSRHLVLETKPPLILFAHRALVANIIAVDVVLPRILIGACKGSGAVAAPTAALFRVHLKI